MCISEEISLAYYSAIFNFRICNIITESTDIIQIFPTLPKMFLLRFLFSGPESNPEPCIAFIFPVSLDSFNIEWCLSFSLSFMTLIYWRSTGHWLGCVWFCSWLDTDHALLAVEYTVNGTSVLLCLNNKRHTCH